MIETMKYVNITGPLPVIDRAVEQYIDKYDIQLDYVTRELSDAASITSFSDTNPYAALLADAAFIRTRLPEVSGSLPEMTIEKASEIITQTAEHYRENDELTKELDEEIITLTKIIDDMSHFKDLDFNIEDLSAFDRIDYRFGKMPLAGYMQFEAYLYEDSKIIIETSDNDGEYVWCVYFAPHKAIDKEDIIFSSLHFTAFDFPKQYAGEALTGTPADAINNLKQRLAGLKKQKDREDAKFKVGFGTANEDISAACDCIEKAGELFNYRKYAGKTSYGYFAFVGWMPAKQAERLSADLEYDTELALVIEDANDSIKSSPPTRLKNNILFRPFEYLIRMYGVPRYDEIDPTPFVAVTYSLFYGMMYGDIGHGAVLSLLGFYLKNKKNNPLGGILAIVGLFSVFFGFMYGSIFGFEEILHEIWLRPSEDIMTLVIVAVSMGGASVIVCMLLNIINAIKARDTGRLLFDQNGVSGIIMYISVIVYALLFALAGIQLNIMFIIALIVLPLILIAFKEPLSALIDKKKKHAPVKGIGMFIFTCIMELVEVILSFFTNTLSFVRIAGYAISHAGLMSVVMLLSERDSGGLNLPVVIIGNLFVMGLEGLIVFIQVMRLQYYEMFSRYYKGGGKEFAATRG